MEYVAGGTMERFCAPEQLLPIEQTVEIIFKCARALDYAHKMGITHRDIKPANILYAAAPTDVRVGTSALALIVGAETDADHRRRLARLHVAASRSARSCSTTAPTSIRSAW